MAILNQGERSGGLPQPDAQRNIFTAQVELVVRRIGQLKLGIQIIIRVRIAGDGEIHIGIREPLQESPYTASFENIILAKKTIAVHPRGACILPKNPIQRAGAIVIPIIKEIHTVLGQT